MRKPAKLFVAVSATLAVLGALAFSAQASAADQSEMVAAGKKIVNNRKEGNCLACHDIKGAMLPGNIGPALVNVKQRFPDKAKLFAQIWDPTKNNPRTIMPPFGRNGILTKAQIEKVVDYIYTL